MLGTDGTNTKINRRSSVDVLSNDTGVSGGEGLSVDGGKRAECWRLILSLKGTSSA